MRRFAVPFAVLLCLVTSVGMASAAPPVKPTPGAAGIGDPYFPDDGNGGYDVQHYDLDLSYEPSTDVLSGTATIAATATQFLSRFNLDLDGLKVRSITVNGAAAKWHRSQGELVITPASPLPNAVAFTTVIVYDGIPGPIPDNEFGGWIPTDDGVVVAGPTARCRDLVPGQRPPDRQGLVHVPRQRPGGPRGGRQRPARVDDDGGRADDVDLGRRRADGDLPRHDQRRRVRCGRVLGGRDRLLGRHRSRPVRSDRRSPDRHAVRDLAGGRRLVQAPGAHDQRARRWRPALVLDRPRHRVPVGLRVRRDPHGRPGRLDDPRKTSTATRLRTPGSSARSGSTSTRS